MMFPVAILAGGLATRLHPVTQQVPKALIDIGGEPFIAHQLRLLRAQGVRRVVLCIGYLGAPIREAVGDGARYGVQVAYSEDGAQLLGTAGALKKALPLLGDAFMVIYGDSYLLTNFGVVATAFSAAGKPALMTVFRNDNRRDASNVEFTDGRIVVYDKAHRTPAMHHIDYGLGVFQAAAFDNVPAGEPCDLALVYQRLLAAGKLAAFEVQEWFLEIGSTAGIEAFRAHIAQLKGQSR
jgi:NDP-sugar pyrophosphorylase family protein